MTSSISRAFVITLILALAPMVASATPVLSPVTGHYYEVVEHPGITWDDADDAATASTYLGITGHLATITSAPEDAFIEGLRTDAGLGELWVGGFQDLPCASGAEPKCGWTWVNGEGTFPGDNMGPEYANWQSGEPNDNTGPGSENHLGIGLGGPGWNDEGALGNIKGYVIEYNVAPEAVDDAVMTDPLTKSGETINIDVLANDHLNGQTVASLDISDVTPGATVEVVGTAPNLSIDYTSPQAFEGADPMDGSNIDTFTYTIVDTDGDVSNPADVSVEVDATTSITPPGSNIPIFGGGPGVPLLAAGEFAPDGGESSIRCCTVRDPRVKLRTRRNGSKKIIHKSYPFDIGKAMGTHLAEGCEDLPQPDRYELIVPGHFSVHTEVKGELDPDKYVFGVCVVETEPGWLGAINMDIDATPAVGYPVDCTRNGIKNQPLTLGLTTSPAEFNAPLMRPVTTECDPRGAPKWSTWYFIPNAVHLPNKLPSKAYVLGRIFVLKLMLLSMQFDQGNPVDSALLNSVWSKVIAARNIVWGSTPPSAALPILDAATVEVLIPDVAPFPGSPYPGSSNFPNPKGELTSHLMALRYAVCSELAHVNDPLSCKITTAVENELPDLPTP